LKTYQWILFDADETLFHFDSFKGLQLMFSRMDIVFTHDDYQEYQVTNKPLWVDYQNGKITADQLQHRRFNSWAAKVNITPHNLNKLFLDTMAEICQPLEGATQLLNSLKGKVKMGIITNGFTQLQQTRLERTGLRTHFELLVISEQVGIAKPHLGIFEHALSLMGNPNRNSVLMVGDTPESDILGGINAGLDTCWLNINKNPTPEGITPQYQVASLLELETFLKDKIA
jgi:5'-nucleotidase